MSQMGLFGRTLMNAFIIMSKLDKIDVFAHFLEFESLDRSDIAYYASIKWVEAFAKDAWSSKNLNFA